MQAGIRTLLFLAALSWAPGALAECARPANADAEIAYVINATNALRASRGLRPLQVSAALTQAAQAHACWMVARDVFSHRGRDGSLPKARLRRVACSASLVAENIAAGYSSGAKTMGIWTESRGHLRNILLGGVSQIGVAVAAPRPGQKNGPRWVQVIASAC